MTKSRRGAANKASEEAEDGDEENSDVEDVDSCGMGFSGLEANTPIDKDSTEDSMSDGQQANYIYKRKEKGNLIQSAIFVVNVQ